jgi:gluconolactonase
MADGSVILVEIARGTLSRVWNGKVEVVCDLGGGPNGAALGQTARSTSPTTAGGGIAGGRLSRPVQGGIDRVDPGRRQGRAGLREGGRQPAVGAQRPGVPTAGRLLVHRLGRAARRTRHQSGVYYARPDGSHVEELSFGGTGYNGIGLSPDETTSTRRRPSPAG